MFLCISLFELGLQPQLANLYPPVQYPVSRGTPMISPLVRWEHSEDLYVMKYLAEVTLQFSFENYLPYLNKLNVSSLQRLVTWNCSDKYFLLILGIIWNICAICVWFIGTECRNSCRALNGSNTPHQFKFTVVLWIMKILFPWSVTYLWFVYKEICAYFIFIS